MTPQERCNAINNDPEYREACTVASKAVNDPALTREQTYIKLVELSTAYGKAAKPYVPCRRGCNACCHMGVGITQTEADALAKASGREALVLDRTLEEMNDEIQNIAVKYYKVPCPFLKDGECSVYEARPLACRTHHVLEDDAENCRTDRGDPPNAPRVAQHGIERQIVMAMGLIMLGEQMADIRKFFP